MKLQVLTSTHLCCPQGPGPHFCGPLLPSLTIKVLRAGLPLWASYSEHVSVRSPTGWSRELAEGGLPPPHRDKVIALAVTEKGPAPTPSLQQVSEMSQKVFRAPGGGWCKGPHAVCAAGAYGPSYPHSSSAGETSSSAGVPGKTPKMGVG